MAAKQLEYSGIENVEVGLHKGVTGQRYYVNFYNLTEDDPSAFAGLIASNAEIVATIGKL